MVYGRVDHFDWQVDAFRASNSGSGDDAVISPNPGLALRANDHGELYLSWERGFHSNDVRGTTIHVDPVTLEDVDPVGARVRSRCSGVTRCATARHCC